MNKCNLVGDLLPLYVENLLSEDSKTLVERHLGRCPACAEKAQRLRSPEPEPESVPVPTSEEKKLLKKAKRKFRKRTALISVGCILLSAIIVFCGAKMICPSVVPVGVWNVWNWDFAEDRCFKIKKDIEVPFVDTSNDRTASMTLKAHNSNDIYDSSTITVSIPDGYTQREGGRRLYTEDSNIFFYSGNTLAFFEEIEEMANRPIDALYTQKDQEAYKTFYHYCIEQNLYNHVEIADMMMRFRLDHVMANSSDKEKALAHVIRSYRDNYRFSGSWYRLLNFVEQKHYHRLTGAVNGYALLGEEWLVFLTTEKCYYRIEIDDHTGAIGRSTEKLAAFLGTIRVSE